MINRRQALASLCVGAFSEQAQAVTPAQMFLPASPQVGGDLRGLTHKGKPFAGFNGKFSLIYFGTAHSLPICAVDLQQVEQMARDLNEKCGGKVVPVFIYPQSKTQRPQENLKAFVERSGSGFVGLTGDENMVLDLARKYRARYFRDAGSGEINNHTRFVYVMDPEGKNLGIIAADALSVLPPKIITERMKQGLNAPVCTL